MYNNVNNDAAIFSPYINLFFTADFGRERIFELQLLLESGVAIPRVAARAETSRSDLRVNLPHDFAEVGR
jgi:hypothetical protein